VKRYIFIIISLFLFLFLPFKVDAVTNPLSTANNKIGVHILFPSELKDATKLVNTSGGDWGYVTIPIQSSDRDLDKWQKFMDDCRIYHLAPIIRLATNGDYFNTKVWEKPNLNTVLDFANFLDSLDWPTKNRFVVIFNEVNRGDEWGGSTNPEEYAKILSYAVTVFKSKSQDFFIISSGMDNASSNNPPESMDKFAYFWDMEKAVPGIFNQIDGLASHSYPNPGFRQLPTTFTNKSVASFSFERDYIANFTDKDLPTFITETGWTLDQFTDSQIGSFYKIAINGIWNDKNIVAITPFILNANTQPFSQFSMKDPEGNSNKIFTAISDIKKTKGEPILETERKVLGTNESPENLPIRKFSNSKQPDPVSSSKKNIVIVLKWLLKID
jgi:hypothetical protein